MNMSSLKDFKNAVKEDMSMLNFPVSRRPANFLETDGTVRPQDNYEFVVRDDTEESIGLISKRYSLVPHAELVSAVENYLNNTFTSNYVTITNMGKNGATMMRHYFFPDMPYEIKAQDDFIPALRVVNSYNRTSLYGLYLDTVRLVCSNGMLGFSRLATISFKHIGKINFADVMEGVNNIIPSMQNLQTLFKEWNSQPVTMVRANKIINAKIPKKLRETVASSFEENENFTRMGLYNALTYTLTHEYEPRSMTPEFARMDKGIFASKLVQDSNLFMLEEGFSLDSYLR